MMIWTTPEKSIRNVLYIGQYRQNNLYFHYITANSSMTTSILGHLNIY